MLNRIYNFFSSSPRIHAQNALAPIQRDTVEMQSVAVVVAPTPLTNFEDLPLPLRILIGQYYSEPYALCPWSELKYSVEPTKIYVKKVSSAQITCGFLPHPSSDHREDMLENRLRQFHLTLPTYLQLETKEEMKAQLNPEELERISLFVLVTLSDVLPKKESFFDLLNLDNMHLPDGKEKVLSQITALESEVSQAVDMRIKKKIKNYYCAETCKYGMILSYLGGVVTLLILGSLIIEKERESNLKFDKYGASCSPPFDSSGSPEPYRRKNDDCMFAAHVLNCSYQLCREFIDSLEEDSNPHHKAVLFIIMGIIGILVPCCIYLCDQKEEAYSLPNRATLEREFFNDLPINSTIREQINQIGEVNQLGAHPRTSEVRRALAQKKVKTQRQLLDFINKIEVKSAPVEYKRMGPTLT